MNTRTGSPRSVVDRDATRPDDLDTAWPSPVLIGVGSEPRRGGLSRRHADLLRDLDPAGGPPPMWSTAALRECLTHLGTSTVTQARRVHLVDAWTDGSDAFCVLYGPPYDEGRVVGLRRRRQSAVEVGEWRPGDLTTWGYEMGLDGEVDPLVFARNVADFDIGEPLGFVVTVLRYDGADIGWWGNLAEDLPRPPSAD